jgi:PIN domain nuclease of toxin-antitoxin system
LLDTHVWLWSLLEPARLGPRTARVLEDAGEKWLSPISLWETLILAERKRVILEPDAERWVRAQLARVPFYEAPLTPEVALASRRLEVASDDPADRFLAATALVYDLTLVTADVRLHHVPGIAVLPNA